MEPSLKFVSCIKWFIFKKKYGSILVLVKKTRGGGSDWGLVKDQTFKSFFSLAPFPKTQSQLVYSFESQSWVKVKVVKWCRKK